MVYLKFISASPSNPARLSSTDSTYAAFSPIFVFAVSFILLFSLFGCPQMDKEEGAQPIGGKPGGTEQHGAPPEGNAQYPQGPMERLPQLPASNLPPGQGEGQPPQEWRDNPMPPQDGQYPQNQQPSQPGASQGQQLPSLSTEAPLPSPPEGYPEGMNASTMLGDVKITYFTNAVARGMMESGTDYFITLENTGAKSAKVCLPSMFDVRQYVPEWNLHFFSMQDSPIEINAGETKKLWYFASLDKMGSFTMNFKLWECGNEAGAVELPVVFGATDENFWGKETSYIFGTVKDDEGNPVSNARVVAIVNCGRMDFKENADAQGNFAIRVLGMEDIEAIYLGRELACDSKDYWVSVEADGYEYYYKAGIAPTRSQPMKLEIVLQKKSESLSYSLEWEKHVDDNYGFFWVKPSDNWSVFAAAQAKHPPALQKPTNFYLFDAGGNILWKQATGDECWGIDISKDGSKIVAGCSDNFVYAVDRSGNLIFKQEDRSLVRTACISNDGMMALSGSIGNLYYFDNPQGTKMLSRDGDWLRNCAFLRDGTGFIAGAREPGGFAMDGTQEWQAVMGEFPLFLGVDENNNVYATGKSRSFFSFDSTGNLRWHRKITEPTITAGGMTSEGNRIAGGSVGAMIYLFDSDGNRLWKRGTVKIDDTMHGAAVGHNALAISEDGTLIVAGTAPGNCIIVYNGYGTIVWQYCADADDSNPDFLLGVTNVQISKDKSRIIASYGDNYIRMFKRD